MALGVVAALCALGLSGEAAAADPACEAATEPTGTLDYSDNAVDYCTGPGEPVTDCRVQIAGEWGEWFVPERTGPQELNTRPIPDSRLQRAPDSVEQVHAVAVQCRNAAGESEVSASADATFRPLGSPGRPVLLAE